eukprot:scaffold72_cov274-Chaetoceros_neogracile.AAC.6
MNDPCQYPSTILTILSNLGDEDATSLNQWNDEIESNFGKTTLPLQTLDDDATPQSIKNAAKKLHETLVFFLIEKDPLQAFDALEEADMNIMKSDLEECLTNSNLNLNDDDGDNDGRKANRVVLALSQLIASQSDSAHQCQSRDVDTIHNIAICSQLIRASKNIIRWNRILYMQSKKTRDPNESFVTATERLCSAGMLSLFLQLLKCAMSKEMNEDRDDLARQCATIVFHASYAAAPEPCCQKALKAFVSSPVNGVEIIAKLISRPNDCQSSYSIHTTLGLIKIVHNLVSTIPQMMEAFDVALKKDTPPVIAHEVQYEVNLFTILVSTLAWALRSEPSFPSSHPMDRRSDLIIEIIHALFAIRSVGSKRVVERMELENRAMMTQLGIIILDLLRLSNRNKKCYDCKLASLLLLMNAPKEYGQFLVVNDGIDELLTILWLQLNMIVVEHAGDVHSAQLAAKILPVLIVLNELVISNEVIRREVKNNIFPANEEDGFLEKIEAHKKEISATPHKGRGAKKNMQPLDAPPGTTRWKLIKLMTYTESNMKRCASELLWNICRKDPNEFVLRCGFGNACHMLSIKGLYQIPK